MTTHSVPLKNAGYLFCLLPQTLLIVGAWLQYPWLSVLFFFGMLPLVRYVVGNDNSPPQNKPPAWLTVYLKAIPRLYVFLWMAVLPWFMWTLAVQQMTVWQYLGFTLSMWIVCSLNTAVAHELIHASSRFDRRLGDWLDASIGYIHFAEEHLSHHAKNGHYHGGDAARPGVTIYAYAARRYIRTMHTAWEYERTRMRRRGLPWHHNRLLRKAPTPLLIAAVFFMIAGWLGLAIYLFLVLGSAFTVQAISYLQHWGLSERETPALADYGFSWEDGCWMQACVTLNHAYHGQHHLNLRKPYYQLTMTENALPLPASYPVMFVAAFFPAFFNRIMKRRLAMWTSDFSARQELWRSSNCIGRL